MKIALFLLGISFINCNAQQEKSVVLPISPFLDVQRSGPYPTAEKYFLVEGFESTKEQKEKIEKFVMKDVDSLIKEYRYFRAVIFKKTGRINRNFKETEADRLNYHLRQAGIYVMEWRNYKYAGISKLVDGVMEYDKKIIVKPIDK